MLQVRVAACGMLSRVRVWCGEIETRVFTSLSCTKRDRNAEKGVRAKRGVCVRVLLRSECSKNGMQCAVCCKKAGRQLIKGEKAANATCPTCHACTVSTCYVKVFTPCCVCGSKKCKSAKAYVCFAVHKAIKGVRNSEQEFT